VKLAALFTPAETFWPARETLVTAMLLAFNPITDKIPKVNNRLRILGSSLREKS
jgi:hypothetical protein